MIDSKYKKGEEVWFYIKPNSGLPEFSEKLQADKSEILDIEFNEDEDIVYVFSKYRCACRHKYLEGECFKTKEELTLYSNY
jgi:hypothetical protein